MADEGLVVSGMICLLAGTLVLSCKIRLFLWSSGAETKKPAGLLLLEDHHTLDRQCDEIAGKVHSLGSRIPRSYTRLLKFSSINENPPATLHLMVSRLVTDHQQLGDDGRFVAVLCRETADFLPEDFLRRFIDGHALRTAALKALSADLDAP